MDTKQKMKIKNKLYYEKNKKEIIKKIMEKRKKLRLKLEKEMDKMFCERIRFKDKKMIEKMFKK